MKFKQRTSPEKTLYYSKNQNAKWICPDCHGEYTYPLNEREVGDDSCPYCADRKVLPGKNDLATLNPELAKEWSTTNNRPVTQIVATFRMKHAKWICPECGGEYSYPLNERKVGDDSCPFCNNTKPLPGYNTFAVKHPDLMQEWLHPDNYLLYVDPDNILDNFSKPVWWECQECYVKYHYRMKINDRLMYQFRDMKSYPFCKGYRRSKRFLG